MGDRRLRRRSTACCTPAASGLCKSGSRPKAALAPGLPRCPAAATPAITGCLKGLLIQGSAALHCYRWQAVAAEDARDAEAAAAAADPQLCELLGSLQQLGLLLPQPLPQQLPTFSLAAPAPPSPAATVEASPTDDAGAAAAKACAGLAGARSPSGDAGAAGSPVAGSSGGGSISVRLVPAGTVQLPQEQLQLALGCSNCLLASMFARGSYCGAAGKLIAIDEPAAASAAGTAAADAAPKCGTTTAPASASGSPAPAPTAPPSSLPEQQPVPMQVDEAVGAGSSDALQAASASAAAPAPVPTPETPAAKAAPATAPAEDGDTEAAAAAEALVRRVLHRVLLLHDKKGLARHKRSRAEEQAAELMACAAAADEAGFLLVPLLGSGAGSGGDGSHAGTDSAGSSMGGGDDGSVDWAAAQEIASVAAFEGTLLDWMQAQPEQVAAGGEAAGGTVEGASATRRSSLSGRVLVTTYNAQAYLFRCVV